MYVTTAISERRLAPRDRPEGAAALLGGRLLLALGLCLLDAGRGWHAQQRPQYVIGLSRLHLVHGWEA